MYVEQGTGARNKPAGAALRAQNYDLLAGSESITRCRQGKAFRQAAVTRLPAGLSADFSVSAAICFIVPGGCTIHYFYWCLYQFCRYVQLAGQATALA